jgi:hypothetical protein
MESPSTRAAVETLDSDGWRCVLLISQERDGYYKWSDTPVLPRACLGPKPSEFAGSLVSDETGRAPQTRTG